MNSLIMLMAKSREYPVIAFFTGAMVLWVALSIGMAIFTREKAVATEQERPAGRSALEQEIQAVLDAQVEAWNKRDLEEFMVGYWKSPDLTFFSGGDVTSGWQQTLDRYRKRYQSEGREMGKLAFSDLRIKQAGDETAWVRGRFKLVTSKEAFGGLFTLVFQRMPEGWRIVHDHTSSGPSPSTQPSPSEKKN
jgi:ketosteroid isomerase-like protein